VPLGSPGLGLSDHAQSEPLRPDVFIVSHLPKLSPLGKFFLSSNQFLTTERSERPTAIRTRPFEFMGHLKPDAVDERASGFAYHACAQDLISGNVAVNVS